MPEWLLIAAMILATLAVFAIAFYVALPWIIRPLVRLLLWPRYSLKVVGAEHVPLDGPAILAVNHVSWIDGFVLAATSPRSGKVLVSTLYIGFPILKQLAIRSGMIPVPVTGPKGHRAVIEAARGVLARGDLLALFPEAQISRTGVPGVLYRGIELILRGHENVPVIPVALDNIWGSVFSFSEGRFFKKRVKGWRRRIGVAYGPPVPPPVDVVSIRRAMVETSVTAFELRSAVDRANLPETLDPCLPRWHHPTLGLLAASAPDFDRGWVKQLGAKPLSVGQAVPGVAIRAVDELGQAIPDDRPGHLQARIAGHPNWIDTNQRGHVDRDGFVFIEA
jgi:1-acyl-sn-glycerol-3-phosphate acyltransferase